MPNVSALSILWRLVLAVSLVLAPLVPMPEQDHDGAVASASAEATTMPCHDMPPPPPASDAPCDDGCCPMPDCDPGACRLAGSLIANGVPVLPHPLPTVPVVTLSSPVLPGIPFGELLRPPIT